MNIKKFKSLVGNKFFTVSFTKKDGTERLLNGRLGVKKYVKGTGRPSVPDDLVIVFDQQKMEYRSFRIGQLNYVKVDGKKILK